MKNAVIYARVSSYGKRQDTERQVLDLKQFAKQNDYNVIKIVEEHASGAKKSIERELYKVVNFAKENQCIILVSELSRIGRNIADVMATVQSCKDNKIQMYIQKENIYLFNQDGKINPMTDMLICVLSIVAQYERENISFRLNSGKQHYIDNGGKIGRRKGQESKETLLRKPGYDKAIKLIRSGRSYSSIIAELNGQENPVHITKPTLIKLKKLFVADK